MPMCASRKSWQCSGIGTNSHAPTTAVCPHLSAPTDFTCTIAGNRHYAAGTMEGPLLLHLTTSKASLRFTTMPTKEVAAPSQPVHYSVPEARLLVCHA